MASELPLIEPLEEEVFAEPEQANPFKTAQKQLDDAAEIASQPANWTPRNQADDGD